MRQQKKPGRDCNGEQKHQGRKQFGLKLKTRVLFRRARGRARDFARAIKRFRIADLRIFNRSVADFRDTAFRVADLLAAVAVVRGAAPSGFGLGIGRGVNRVHGGDKAVAVLRHGFDELISVVVLTEGFSQRKNILRNRGLFDESISPNLFQQFIFADDAAAASHEQRQSVESLWS
ncbi:MAG TPA: hypothetical protein VF656_17855 [Pyrinomonadaceae bacterium]